DTITLKAVIKDNGIIRYTRANEAPRLYYRKNSGSGWSSFTAVLYSNIVRDTFYFKIPGSGYTTQVEYYFAAQDIKLPTPLVSTLPAGGSGINPPGSTPPSIRFSYTVTPATIINENTIATEYRLYDNYPNPFNPTTTIKFSIKENSFVKLNLYDITGRLVKEIYSGFLKNGIYSTLLNASDLNSGIYFIRFIAGDYIENKKVILIK
ncbi:MAG: T9SS type A sorting domain-containing protein, partial [Ignavibacteria bacterium]|nr:T9SS type A sorting domain-containing protein [Ignavibacteria bacterium]